MNQAHHAQQVYADQGIRFDSPLGLVARVYQIARLEAKRAAKAVEANDVITKAKSTSRLLRAVALLHDSLDMDNGGEVAVNLDRLYGYLIRTTSMANVNNDSKLFMEVSNHLDELGTAWDEVAKKERTKPRADLQVELSAAP